jgi:hypothetical protein
VTGEASWTPANLTIAAQDNANVLGYMTGIDTEAHSQKTYSTASDADEAIWTIEHTSGDEFYRIRNTQTQGLLGNWIMLYTNAVDLSTQSDYPSSDVSNTEIYMDHVIGDDSGKLFHLYVMHPNGKMQYIVPMIANFSTTDMPISLVSEDHFSPYNDMVLTDYSESQTLTDVGKFDQFVWRFTDAAPAPAPITSGQ